METLARAANRGSISTGGYEIEYSVKNEQDNGERFQSTNLGTPSSTKIFTFSMWVKRTEIINRHFLHKQYNTGISMDLAFANDSSTQALFYVFQNSTTDAYGKTTALFRDTSAWYHIVWRVDTTQATAADRVRIYVNGVQQDLESGNGSASTYPSQNYDVPLQTTHYLLGFGGSDGFCGYCSQYYYIDGQSLAPTDFGEFDSATGIWKPIEYTGTFGNAGYYLDFADASALGKDVSPNNQGNFSHYGGSSADQATDTPTNNFATNNPLAQNDMNPLQGATQWTHNNASDWESSISTIGVTSGKWYFEASMDSTGNMIGIIANNGITDSLNCMDSYPGDRLNTQNAGIGYHGAGNVFQNDTFTSGMPTYGGGNIISCALDMDNGYVYFARNGSWINSGDPTSGSSGTGGWAVYDTSDIQFFATAIYSTADNIKCNWGGYRIYSISSAETDANGYGTFEYAPPSGYYALCSKNLAEFG